MNEQLKQQLHLQLQQMLEVHSKELRDYGKYKT